MATQHTADDGFVISPGLAGKLIAWLMVGVTATIVLLMLLPNKDYYRWQQSDGTIMFRARTVYERIHFDKKPIDVAFIGSSRIEAGIRRDDLSAGLSSALGHPVAVENLGLPIEGRDLQWAEAKELLETRSDVKLIVLILQPELNVSHPAFRFLGDDASIAGAPIFLNPSYALNMLTLPYRHLAYFVQGLWPWAFQLSPDFDPAIYKAHSFDPSKTFRMPYGVVINRDQDLAPDEAATPDIPSEPTGYRSKITQRLPIDQRYAIDRHYTRLITALARKRHVAIAFLSVPVYHRGQEIYDDLGFFQQFGPTLSGSFVANDPANYMDSAHLNRTGSAKLTPWLLEQLIPIARKAEERK